MLIFDSHAHYDDDMYKDDIDELIKEFKKNNVIGIINCGVDHDSCLSTIDLIKRYDIFYGSIGFHPESSHSFCDDSLDFLNRLKYNNNKIIAIGEIGLDYYHKEISPKEHQIKVFEYQMKLAKDLNLPVIVHDRDAHKDTLDSIKKFKGLKGVMHAFSGSSELAKEYIKLGYYIGIGGVATFKNSKKIIDVIRDIDIQNILVETDAPYMTPEPFRGKRNRSDYIYYVIDKISSIKNIDAEELSKILIDNSFNLFNIVLN
ncbi:MAG: TatD family hydrolase [Oscillospiraceae bacterium]|nr:TatD family hydrolase [Oscillospiraceae bacterium]